MATQTKSQQTEAALKDAARRVLLRQGFAQLKITDVTTEAGRSAGVFYRYFTDKFDLLRALARDFDQALTARVVQEVGDAHDLHTADDVREHVAAYWATWRDHRAELVGLYEASVSHSEFAVIWGDLRERQVAVWRAHLEDLHEGPDAADPITALAVVLMLEQLCYTRMAGPVRAAPAGDDDDAVAAVSRLISGGLGIG